MRRASPLGCRRASCAIALVLAQSFRAHRTFGPSRHTSHSTADLLLLLTSLPTMTMLLCGGAAYDFLPSKAAVAIFFSVLLGGTAVSMVGLLVLFWMESLSLPALATIVFVYGVHNIAPAMHLPVLCMHWRALHMCIEHALHMRYATVRALCVRAHTTLSDPRSRMRCTMNNHCARTCRSLPPVAALPPLRRVLDGLRRCAPLRHHRLSAG